MNCAGLEREFLETELFGHVKGAFTGAVQAKPGLLEVADKGTVFLDEIGDMDLAVEPKILKVLETKRFRRLGNVHDRTVDIRLISATHRNLREFVRRQRFREDLYFASTSFQFAFLHCANARRMCRSWQGKSCGESPVRGDGAKLSWKIPR